MIIFKIFINSLSNALKILINEIGSNNISFQKRKNAVFFFCHLGQCDLILQGVFAFFFTLYMLLNIFFDFLEQYKVIKISKTLFYYLASK